MRDIRCRASEEAIEAALIGNYQPGHVFALRQSLALCDFYQTQVSECNRQIEEVLHGLSRAQPVPVAPLPKPRQHTKQPNAVEFDVSPMQYQTTGTDPTQIHGVGPHLSGTA